MPTQDSSYIFLPAHPILARSHVNSSIEEIDKEIAYYEKYSDAHSGLILRTLFNIKIAIKGGLTD